MIKVEATAVCGDGACKERCTIQLRLVQSISKRDAGLITSYWKPISLPVGWEADYFRGNSVNSALNVRCPLHSTKAAKILTPKKTKASRFAKLLFDDN